MFFIVRCSRVRVSLGMAGQAIDLVATILAGGLKPSSLTVQYWLLCWEQKKEQKQNRPQAAHQQLRSQAAGGYSVKTHALGEVIGGCESSAADAVLAN